MTNSIEVITLQAPIYWTHVTGVGVDDFNGTKKEFNTMLLQAVGDAQVLLEQSETLYQANSKEGYTRKSTGYTMCDENGKSNSKSGVFYGFTFRTKTTYKDGGDSKVVIYDSNGNETTLSAEIGNGTSASIAGTLRYYSHEKSKTDGISYFLRAIKIYNFVPYVKKSKVPNFGTQAGTFVGTPTAEPKPSPFAHMPPKQPGANVLLGGANVNEVVPTQVQPGGSHAPQHLAAIEHRTKHLSEQRAFNTPPSMVDVQTQLQTQAQPVLQPAPQPVLQPVPQPVQQPVPQPVLQPVPQPVPQPVYQHVQQPVPQPVYQHVQQPLNQTTSATAEDQLLGSSPSHPVQM